MWNDLRIECREGLYGERCSQLCSGNCKDNETCNHVTGQCDKGCTTGWKGAMCDKGNRVNKYFIFVVYSAVYIKYFSEKKSSRTDLIINHRFE